MENQTTFLNVLKNFLGAETEEIKTNEENVREKAYLLWEAAGKPESDGVEFWLLAEREISN